MWEDDRDRQGTLDLGIDALATGDRGSKFALGSDAFADDRDHDRGVGGEQASLFGETESLDGQADLTGGQATVNFEGFFENDPADNTPGVGPLMSTEERDLGWAEVSAMEEIPDFPEAAAFDVSLSPDEAFRGVGSGTREERNPMFTLDEPGNDSLIGEHLAAQQQSTRTGVRSGPVEIDMVRLDNATDIREQYPGELHMSDHRGHTTVTFEADAPEHVFRRARAMRDEARAEVSRSQVAGLTEAERERVSDTGGFDQKTTVANWRSAKGVFEREGLSDQYWDAIPSLADHDDPIEGAEEYVSRHRNRMMTSNVGGVGGRDVGETDLQMKQAAADAAKRELGEAESHAIKGAKQGHEAAINALIDEAGWEPQEARALAGRVDDPSDALTEQRFQEVVRAEILRARSNGRFVRDPADPAPGVRGFRSSTTGRFVGNSLDDPDIGRDPADGRFVSMDRGERL